jgi:preprotein translocase subunit YajC
MKKYIAGTIFTLFMIGIFGTIFYRLIYEPIKLGYEQYGLTGALISLISLIIMFLIVYFIVKLLVWSIDTLTK